MMKHHHHKKPTPQDLYKARRKREEDEKEAFLPPGLINHGNTCFMNSTLQGLFATPLLYDFVSSGELPLHWQDAAGASIISRRSPLLTNGHGVGGQYELRWVEGMPLGDVFLMTMQRAWKVQDNRRRESTSPKEILAAIGRKYDQYMDFQQQDAHEFLRHLLDAMRMEEMDIIKKRQPPPPKAKRKKLHRRTTQSEPTSSTSTPYRHTTSPTPSSIQPTGDDKLESFIDMLFGGKLASILVCEKCKKISVTYEDFNDLSLSIKPEDYVKERKRDRLKLLAKKLRFKPSGKDMNSCGSGVGALPVHRSSSVPPSPIRRSMDVATHDEEPPVNVDPRRRSFEHGRPEEEGKSSEEDARGEVRRTAEANGEGVVSVPSTVVDGETSGEGDDEREGKLTGHVGFVEPEIDGKMGKRNHKEKDKGDGEHKKDNDDPWAKLGRRISISMKMGKKDKSKRLSRSMDRRKDVSTKEEIGEEGELSTTPVPTTPSSVCDSGSDLGDISDATRSRGISPAPSPLASPPVTLANTTNPIPNMRRATTEPVADKRAKSPRPPKPTPQESAYLRRILADVNPSTPSAFSMLHQALSGTSVNSSGSTSTPITAQALLAKLGNLPGIEECLRMFTSVEILDGDNMVGCHRCWKIAKGTYKPRKCREDEEEHDSEAEADEDDDELVLIQPEDLLPFVDANENNTTSAPDSSIFSSTPDLIGHVSPASTSSIVTSQSHSSIFLPDTASVSSAPTTLEHTPPQSPSNSPKPRTPPPPINVDRRQTASSSTNSPAAHVTTFGGLPIPSISTTAPESPLYAPVRSTTDHSSEAPRASSPLAVSPSDDSLLTPRAPRQRFNQPKVKSPLDSSESSDEDDYDDSASDASGSVSGYSDASSLKSAPTSPIMSPRESLENLRSPLTSAQASRTYFRRTQSAQSVNPSPKPKPEVPRSQQVVMRRMYKRYLIAAPPPILMVHLKRFQQISKMYAVSFSGGFKKLDDFVAFPEYLDLKPFLAPKKEDFGLGRHKDKSKKKGVKEERCMYRLYAVVVHIGNMLGGHYIAYTALPSKRTSTSPSSSPKLDTNNTSQAPQSDSGSTTEQTKRPRQWAYISDTVVRLTTVEEVLKAKAYICMYERI